jgi:hypothetical protein
VTYNINVRLTAQAQTLAEALALAGKFSAPGFKIDEVSVTERWQDDGVTATAVGAADVEVVAAVTEAAAAAATTETAPKSRTKATKPAAAPAPAPASAAPAAPAPAPAAASPATATHADLRAILVPIATVDAAGSKRVTKFIRDNGYMGTVDAIPAADLPALIVKAKTEFA